MNTANCIEQMADPVFGFQNPTLEFRTYINTCGGNALEALDDVVGIPSQSAAAGVIVELVFDAIDCKLQAGVFAIKAREAACGGCVPYSGRGISVSRRIEVETSRAGICPLY